MTRQTLLFLSSAAMTLGSSAASGAGVTVERLRCEYLTDPLGIDTPRPRLSWVIRSDRRGEVQTAWQVLVASSEEKLRTGTGDLWDSGRVESSQTAHVVYDGVPLQSRQQCFWKVRVWGRDGVASPFSPTATWEMGLLKPEDWTGQWIGTGRAILPVTSLTGSQWIGPPEDDGTTAPGTEGAAGAHNYRREIAIPGDRNPQSARLRITAHGPAVIFWNGEEVGRTEGRWDEPLSLDLLDRLRTGGNWLAVSVAGTTAGAALAANFEAVFDSGGILKVISNREWQVSRCRSEGWQTGAAGGVNWRPAREVKRWGEAPWTPGPEPDARANAAPAPMLRRVFSLDGPVRRARLSICGLGYAEVSLNGRKVGDHVLDPAYTDYAKRLLYVTHDVTEYLKTGKNALGVTLGTGWYDVHTLAVWNFDAAPWRHSPRMILRMDVELEDGRRVSVASDGEWKHATGPTVFDSIYEGETYDARREKPGWDTAGYDDSGWEPVRVLEAPKGALRAQMLPPMRVTETLKPVRVTEPRPGVYVYDLGVNIAGFPRLTIEGPAGTTVTMKCGERLNADGTVDQREIAVYTVERDPRQRLQTSVYTLKGEGREVWEPRFHYAGFQYVEVTGAPGPLTLDNLEGRVVHTDLERVGRFECSNALLNRIHEAAVRAYLGNLHGIPTDCPTREKNGWTGDAHIAAELGIYNFDGSAFYTKWLNDLADAQRPDGDLPGIVPSSGWGYGIGIGPAWDSAFLHIPWDLYRYYGDVRILETHFDGMRRYVDFLTSRAENGIVSYGLGDWVPFDTQTSPALTSTSYYYRDAVIVSEVAKILGKEEEARRYQELAGRIRKAFNARFFHEETGLYDNGSQTALSCALYQGLVEPEHVARVVENLVEAVAKRDYHIDTGLLGSKYLLNVLLDHGRADVAYRVASQKTLPGWGWWIEQGATTLWEQWKGTDSRNHVMFGDIGAWFYKALAGIRVEEPGFREFIIRPRIVDGLTSASAEYQSIAGLIVSAWSVEGDTLTLRVRVPANTRARVYVPASDGAEVREGGRPAGEAEGVRPAGREADCAVFEVGSGEYEFTAPWRGSGSSGFFKRLPRQRL